MKKLTTIELCRPTLNGAARQLALAASALLLFLGWGLSGLCNVRAAAPKAAPNADVPPEARAFLFGEEPTTTPVGNIGKDLPGFTLPLTAAGAAALHHNLTTTVDPESLCIIGGIPRHSASVLPVDGRSHDPDPDPSFFGDKIGRWKGDTFVIDSLGFKSTPIWIDENANP